MGVLYRARDLRLDRTVALKFLPPGLSDDAQAKRRFLTEARAAAALDHANVCTVHEIGETEDGQLFIAMAYVEGESLRQLIERGPLPVRTAIGIACQIASGLERAHERGIVHRDVKPANVMVGVDGVVKLVDFGVAKLAGSTLTSAGATPGTAAYMSPEQARGEEVDHRTDLWSLGVVLYEMLAGVRPFAGDTDAALLRAITESAPARLRAARVDVPVDVERVVVRALERAREGRFQSALLMRDALQRAGEADDAVHLSPQRRLSRRAFGLALGGATLVVVALAATGVSAWRRVARSQAVASLPRGSPIPRATNAS